MAIVPQRKSAGADDTKAGATKGAGFGLGADADADKIASGDGFTFFFSTT